MTLITNPPFDKRIYHVHGLVNSLKGKGLTRGRIRTDTRNKEGDKNRYGCNFLYNPTALQTSHGIDTSIVPVTDPSDISTAMVPLQQSVSWSLLFDRTYETWDRSYNNRTVGKQGVLADVLALYNVVGITLPIGNGAATGDSSGSVGLTRGTGAPATMAISPMVYVPVWVYFGGPLKYYGVIQTLGVTYTHWTQNMVPNRCSIDLTMQLLPKPPGHTRAEALDDIEDNNARAGIIGHSTSMADMNRIDYGGGRSGR